MLYHIRKTLGADVIKNRGSEEIAINPNQFWCDAIAFDKAMKEKEYETALNFYHSDLLKGFYIQEASSEFDHWLEKERKRFHLLALEGSCLLAEKAFEKRNYKEAIAWSKKASELDPYSEKVHLRHIRFLYESGEYESAIKEYVAFSELIKLEFGEEPGQEFKDFFQFIKKKKSITPIFSSTENKPKESITQVRIAVLPFESIGHEKSSSFTDAIHSDILTRLSQVSDLFVISRTSVRNYRNTAKLLPEIARELQVDWILAGEVQEIEEQVKVSVRLVNALQDRQVWAEIYQKEMSAGEVFKIQSEITHHIFQSLEMRLTSKEKKAIKHIPTEDLEAFRLHAHGKWNLDQRSEKAMRLAEGYFRAAIARDPKYAQAWMGLSDALSLLHDYGYEKNEFKIFPEAEKAAKKALKIDSNLASAYASLGLLYTTRRNGKDAIANLKKAIALRQGYAEAHIWLCWVLLLTGSSDEGLENAKKGVEWNPHSQEAISNLSLAWLAVGEFENALQEARRLSQLQPDFTTAHLQAGLALYHLGRYQEAIELLRDLSVPWAGNGPAVTMILSYYREGREAEAINHIKKIKDDPFGMGLIQLIEGKYEQAYELFLSIVKWNYWEMLSLHFFYPDLLDRVREDKRFKYLLNVISKNWGMFIGIESKPMTNQTHSDTFDSRLYENSIAVLPFKDLGSEEPRFTDGIHGNILTSLSGIKNLHAISRMSVNHYDTTGKTALEIGQYFKTAWLLEGEVRQSSSKIEIKVRLNDISKNIVVWTDFYHEKLTVQNIFFVQQQIISKILEILKVQLSEKEEQQVITTPTSNLKAYRLYTQGRNCLDQRTESGIYKGFDCFQTSIELDPEYALAWSGLADAISLLEYYGYVVPKNFPSSLEVAKKAVELDPGLGEAHTSLGIAYSNCQKGPEALREMEKAVELIPGDAEGLIWLGWLYLMLGRPKAALEPAQKAVKLNPLSSVNHVFLSEIYLANGKLEEALTEGKRGREINPEYGLANFMEGLILYHMKYLQEAKLAFEKALTQIPDRGTPTKSQIKTVLAFTAYAEGDKSQGYELKNNLYRSIDPFPLGMLHALHGELNEAFQLFERVQEWSSFSVEILRYFFPESLFLLRQDIRYTQLITKINQIWGLTAEDNKS